MNIKVLVHNDCLFFQYDNRKLYPNAGTKTYSYKTTPNKDTEDENNK